VSKMVNGDKPIPLEHMAPIEEFTGKQVTRQEMLPDGWQTIWPELAYAQAAPAQPAIKAVADAQAAIKHVEAEAVAAIGQAATEIKNVAEELLKADDAWDGATERRQGEAPWDGKTERRKLDAPIDRRVSPASVAHAEFLRAQATNQKQQGV
jgi:DNA-binding transcriptional regulator YdaS (Cro superfamily)